jgi:hypothetical protein
MEYMENGLNIFFLLLFLTLPGSHQDLIDLCGKQCTEISEKV